MELKQPPQNVSLTGPCCRAYGASTLTTHSIEEYVYSDGTKLKEEAAVLYNWLRCYLPSGTLEELGRIVSKRSRD